MTDNIHDIIALVHTARLLDHSVPAVVLVDVRGAFPSFPRERTWLVPRRVGAPDWLVATVQALYYVLHRDRLPDTPRHFAGVACVRTLWAILFDPVIRALVQAHPEPQWPFADDLGVAFLNVLRSLPPVMEVFGRLPLAMGLHLHIPKVKVVNCTGLSDFALRGRQFESTGGHALDAVGPNATSASRLRLLRRAQNGTKLWGKSRTAAPLSDRRRRTCATRSPGTSRIASPSFSSWASSRRRRRLCLRSRLQRLARCVRHPCTRSRQEFSRPCRRLAFRPASAPSSKHAAQLQCVSPVDRKFWTTSGPPSTRPPAPIKRFLLLAMYVGTPLPPSTVAHRCPLPPSTVAHPRPEAPLRRHFASLESPGVAREWLRRRLGHLLGARDVDCEVDLVLVSLGCFS